MSKKNIEKALVKALLENEDMSYTLFHFELKENVEKYLKSKKQNKDAYFFAVTENTAQVAMLLIDKKNKLHINEKARALLKKYWGRSYEENMQLMIPQMAEGMSKGYIYVTGVKVEDS